MDNLNKIKKYIEENNGIIKTSDIVKQGYSKMYLKTLSSKNEIERISRGIYIDNSTIEDEYYIMQSNTKIIYSHMTALYLHGIAEQVPGKFDITVPSSYNSKKIKDCNIFYASNEVIDIGITEIESPYGNLVKLYSIERCICDIIRSKNRMDSEQVKKCVKEYIKQNKDNHIKLIDCAKKLKVYNKIISYMEPYYE
jgi:Predicted transcriptional regulator